MWREERASPDGALEGGETQAAWLATRRLTRASHSGLAGNERRNGCSLEASAGMAGAILALASVGDGVGANAGGSGRRGGAHPTPRLRRGRRGAVQGGNAVSAGTATAFVDGLHAATICQKGAQNTASLPSRGAEHAGGAARLLRDGARSEERWLVLPCEEKRYEALSSHFEVEGIPTWCS